jgi:putative acetyltransferase
MTPHLGPPPAPALARAEQGLPGDVAICAALAADLPAVRRAVSAAFGYDLEARLVARLEREGRVTVSLVARAGGGVVGHAMLSRAALVAHGGSWPALALAPVAVVPERQRCGIGSALVRACLALSGPHLPVFVIGAPGFYGRFGFEPAEPYGVTSRFDVPIGHFMVRPGAGPPAPLPRLLDYPPAFG